MEALLAIPDMPAGDAAFLALITFAAGAVRGFSGFALPAMLGAMIGARFFTPGFERHYRNFCLLLLIALAAPGIVRAVA